MQSVYYSFSATFGAICIADTLTASSSLFALCPNIQNDCRQSGVVQKIPSPCCCFHGFYMFSLAKTLVLGTLRYNDADSMAYNKADMQTSL